MERLAELNALLDMDHKENEIVDGEIAENGNDDKSKELQKFADRDTR